MNTYILVELGFRRVIAKVECETGDDALTYFRESYPGGVRRGWKVFVEIGGQ